MSVILRRFQRSYGASMCAGWWWAGWRLATCFSQHCHLCQPPFRAPTLKQLDALALRQWCQSGFLPLLDFKTTSKRGATDRVRQQACAGHRTFEYHCLTLPCSPSARPIPDPCISPPSVDCPFHTALCSNDACEPESLLDYMQLYYCTSLQYK
jgi:hypothetical protein